jgi:hypothetical protein
MMSTRPLDLFKALFASLLLAGSTTACMAQHTAPSMMMASVDTRDAAIATAFRALIDQVIGDSADKVCLSVATTAGDGSLIDADPSGYVMQRLRGVSTTVVPRSTCAADERNFGNPRGLLRLRDVAPLDEHTLIVHAEAIGDHSARYECVVPESRGGQRTRCKITDRDWPGSQRRG